MTDLQHELNNALRNVLRVANESAARVTELEEQIRRLQIDVSTTLIACSQCGRGWPLRYLVAEMCGDCAEKYIMVLNVLIEERDRVLSAIPECPEHGLCVPHALAWVEERKRD